MGMRTIVSALPLAFLACDGDRNFGCPSGGATAVVLNVTDVSGADICDASAIVIDGQSMVTFDNSDPGAASDASCSYSLYRVASSGTYEISVSAPGFQPAKTTATITIDACGHATDTQHVSVTLKR